MRHWYVIYDGKEYECGFVAVNVLRCWMHLSLNGKTFKVTYHSKRDYEYAKRGEPTQAIAITRNTNKSCKIVFK
jgi:hypothetical protein